MKERHSSGLRLIDHVLQEKSWELFTENEIKDSDFYGQALAVLRHIRDYVSETDSFPPKDFIQEELNFEFPEEIPRGKALSNFFRHKKSKAVEKIIHAADEAAKKGNPDLALSIMVDGTSEVKPDNKIKSFNETAVARYEAYQQDKLKPLKGVYPPFETYQKNILIWENSTFNVIMGISSVGKSWISAYSALYAAYTQNKKVLLVSMENSYDSMTRRLDGLYHKLPFNELRAHILDMRLEEIWGKEVEKMTENAGDVLVADAATIKAASDIYQIAQVDKPDLVIVDGAYKLASADFESSSKLLDDLFKFAVKTEVPWVATTQLNPTANTSVGSAIGREGARGNRNWYMDPATVLTIIQSEEQKLDNIIECHVGKDREGGSKEGIEKTFKLSFDMDRMIIGEVNQVIDQEILDTL